MTKELTVALEGLKRERAEVHNRGEALDRAIADLTRTIEVLDPDAAPMTSESPKEFTGMTLRAAAETVLKRAQAPMPTRMVCDLLIAGGFRTSARDFYMVVYSGLKSMPNFARTQAGHWVWTEGATAGAILGESAAKAKAKGHGKAKG